MVIPGELQTHRHRGTGRHQVVVQAGEMGYRVSINEEQIAELLVWELESQANADNKLRALRILKLLNSKVNYPAFITKLEETEQLTVNQLFRMTELKQLCGVDCQIDTLHSYQKETIFGNVYYASDSSYRSLLNNDIQNTLIAYRILRTDSTVNHHHTLSKIRNYLYEQRSDGSWLNTYESARIIETILPDLLADDHEIKLPTLVLTGAIDKTLDEFPFQT